MRLRFHSLLTVWTMCAVLGLHGGSALAQGHDADNKHEVKAAAVSPNSPAGADNSHAVEEGQSVVVHRVPGSDPLLLNVRCTEASASELLMAVANESGLKIQSVPAELDVRVKDVILRSMAPADALEAIAGTFGLTTQIVGGAAVFEAVPTEFNDENRAHLRKQAESQYGYFLVRGSLSPKVSIAWQELAALQEESGDFAGAIETLRAYRETIGNERLTVRADVEIGRLEILRGHYTDALLSLGPVADKYYTHPMVSQAFTYLGVCRLAMGEPMVARSYFEIVLEKFPTSEAAIVARISRIEALRQLGELELAWNEIGTLESLNLSIVHAIELLHTRTLMSDAYGYHQDALEGWLALASLTHDPANRKNYLERANRVSKLAGDWLAELMLRCAIQPENRNVIIGTWLAERGFAELAARHMRESAEVQLSAIYELVLHGEYESARRLLKELPADRMWTNIRQLVEAELSLRARNPERVPELLSEAIRNSKDERFVNAALRCLGDSYLAMNDLERAELAYLGVIPEVPSR